MSLPFASLLVGVDEFEPTKLVYAIYDSSLSTIRFVHGDGTYAVPETICFMEAFRGGSPETGARQRLHFIVLIQRSTDHYQACLSAEPFQLAVYRGRFITSDAVKSALMYYSDLDANAWERIPALAQLPPQGDYTPVPDEDYTQTFPCTPLSTGPKWNFDPRLLFQPLAKSHTG